MKNKPIAEQLKQEILRNKEIEMTIRSRAKGCIMVFLRNNICQKIRFKAVEIDSRNLDSDEWDGIELPDKVYRRFCLLLCDVISDLPFSLEYGHLICEWEFNQLQDSDEWEDHFKLSFEKETHFKQRTSNVARPSLQGQANF